jgi:stage V sporulation protein B
MSTPLSIFAVKTLVPVLIIVAILGVMRGFFQGLGTMMPSAISQIFEQIVNAIVSIWAAYVLYSYGAKVGAVLGNPENLAAAYGAAGGTIGTGSGAAAALIFVTFVLVTFLGRFKRSMRRDASKRVDSYGTIFKMLFVTIIPVLLSSTIYNCNSIIDEAVYKKIAFWQGYSDSVISVQNGIFSGKYQTLINIPISIAAAVAASSVPALTAAYAENDSNAAKKQIALSTRFIMIISFPCAVGMGVLASPILNLLFHDTSDLAGRMVTLGAISIVFFALSTLSNGLLQGIGRMREPIKNAVIALILHVIVLVALMMVLDLNIYAVVIANAVFGLFMCLLNAYSIHRYSGYEQEIKKTFLVPAAASAIMGVTVWLLYRLLQYIFRINAISTLVSIVVGAIVYAVFLLRFGGLNEHELYSFPKGRTLAVIAKKLHLL